MESLVSEIFVEVLLDQNLSKALDYAVPQALAHLIQVGMRVEVPLKSSVKKGTIAQIKSTSNWPNPKPIFQLLSSTPEISDTLWKLAHWMSHYYCTPLQRVLKCFIPVNIRKKVQQKTQILLKLKQTHDASILAITQLRGRFPLQADLLDRVLQHPKGVLFTELNASRSTVAALVKKNLLVVEKITSSGLEEEEFFATQPKTLNTEQTRTLSAIQSSIQARQFAAHLIYGVTGSGKTEIYMQAIQTALDQNQSAIMLVPEISLTSQTIERFRARFAQKIAVLHHRRSLGERSTAWEELRKGETKLVIGARSALFCPAQNLGLIIVDEEHDSSYKQSDEMPCYQGRDVAVMRAHLEHCPIILASATPSIESRYNAQIGKYQLHTLEARATSAQLPTVTIIDMAQALERNKGFTHFSDELARAIQKRIETGEQALLFLNRRGYHRMQICQSCHSPIKCPHCDLSLAFHREANSLQCHLCGHEQPLARHCPHCHANESLQFKGFGTEHVERALHALFPNIRTLRMDKDTTTKKESHEEIFQQFRAHKADVLIGTQMIAKGFHFPSVTLVGILNPDATLAIPDFRAPEQLFQLLTQVAGRAGRAELAGEVIIQTFSPHHPLLAMAAAQDYPAFYNQALEERRLFKYPPFSHLIKLVFSAPTAEEAVEKAKAAHKQLSPLSPLPVSPAGHAKVKDLFRFQFLIQVDKVGLAIPLLKEIQGAKIDVDPLSTYF